MNYEFIDKIINYQTVSQVINIFNSQKNQN